MAKIVIDKNETADSVVRKIKSAEDKEVVLVVPRDSFFTSSPAAIKAIKKEAAAAKKKLVIESVDADVLTLAEKNDIPSVHPLFQSGRGARAFSDIVVGNAPEVRVSKGGRRGKKVEPRAEGPAVPAALGEMPAVLVEEEEEEVSAEPQPVPGVKINPLELGKESPKAASVFPPSRFAPSSLRQPSFLRRKTVLISAAVLVLLIAGYVWARAFGRVRIEITFAKTPWQHEHALFVSKEIAEADAAGYRIPGELFFDSKNVTQSFPASLREQVSLKAHGTITIYNEYNTAPQSLVATTRFMTPDGKIFRIDRGVAVPGATKEGSTLRPTSIDAAVTADSPGPLYNVSSSKLTIPGFAGSPKHEGFYGVIKEPLTGGFTGERGVASDKDIVAAKEKVAATLKTVFESGVFDRLPQGFVVLPEASEITVGVVSATKVGDDKGNFTASGEARVRGIGFREADVVAVLEATMSKESAGKKFRDLRIVYEGIAPNFAKGELTATMKVDADLEPAFDTDGFRDRILGKKAKEVRGLLAEETGLEDAKISFWPLWLSRVPFNLGRVTVTVL